MAETITDSVLRREIYLNRFASFLINEYVITNTDTFSAELLGLLNSIGDPSEMNRKEKAQTIKIVSDAIRESWGEMWSSISSEMSDMALLDVQHISDIYADIANVDFKIPADPIITGFINTATMVLTSGTTVQTGVWAEFTKRNITSVDQQVTGTIFNGYREGLTNAQIARNIRGTYNRKKKTYEGGLLQGRVKAQSEALTRTGVSHYSNSARDRMYQANEDILANRILIATLDNRTTNLCYSRNLNTYRIRDDTYPRLPFHFNERSVYIVQVKGDDVLGGKRPSIGGKSNDPDAFKKTPKYRGRRDSDVYGVKQVDADITTDNWLKRQPRAFVASALGETKAKLFLDGGMSVKSFVDASGKQLTLKNLRTVGDNEKAFRKAGL